MNTENKPAPTCPYCGEEMKIDDGWLFPFYMCPKCRSTAPFARHANANDEAYEAAMRRADRPKGKWIDTAPEDCQRYNQHDYKCSICNIHADYFVFGYEWDIGKAPNFCPHCGAEMEVDILAVDYSEAMHSLNALPAVPQKMSAREHPEDKDE